MARGNQTFQKRQRENKLREKAQQKRERREQRKIEKRQVLTSGGQPTPVEELENPVGTGAPASDLFGGGQ
jgi:hypothetical protein